MRDHYDFSERIKNSYSKKLKRQVAIRLDADAISYFKRISEEKGILYQSLFNLYLRDFTQSRRDLKLKWQ